jgi:UDP-glucose 4-epimerase
MTDRPTVLVTGGAGYIGSHACRALAAAGYQPVVYDNLSTGHRSFVAGPLVTGDLLDGAALARAFADHKVKAVMHFAAASLVGESMTDPQKYYINNLQGTLSLLQAMRNADCHRIVFSSTGAVYGNADSKELPEDFPCAPINPYGASKWMIERMLADYRAAYGFGAFCLRYFNASGADPAGGIGELRDNETHLIPRAMMALQGHVDFAVFGDDYDTPDGSCIRDYVHVSDIADAHIRCLQSIDEIGADAFNIGNGNGYSNRQVIDAVQRVTGRPIAVVKAPRRPGDPARLVASAQHIGARLGWSPAVTDLTTMIESAWTWTVRHTGHHQTTRP